MMVHDLYKANAMDVQKIWWRGQGNGHILISYSHWDRAMITIDWILHEYMCVRVHCSSLKWKPARFVPFNSSFICDCIESMYFECKYTSSMNRACLMECFALEICFIHGKSIYNIHACPRFVIALKRWRNYFSWNILLKFKILSFQSTSHNE